MPTVVMLVEMAPEVMVEMVVMVEMRTMKMEQAVTLEDAAVQCLFNVQ